MSDLAKGRRRSKAQPKIWEGRPIMNYWTPGNHDVIGKQKYVKRRKSNKPETQSQGIFIYSGKIYVDIVYMV